MLKLCLVITDQEGKKETRRYCNALQAAPASQMAWKLESQGKLVFCPTLAYSIEFAAMIPYFSVHQFSEPTLNNVLLAFDCHSFRVLEGDNSQDGISKACQFSKNIFVESTWKSLFPISKWIWKGRAAQLKVMKCTISREDPFTLSKTLLQRIYLSDKSIY